MLALLLRFRVQSFDLLPVFVFVVVVVVVVVVFFVGVTIDGFAVLGVFLAPWAITKRTFKFFLSIIQ